MQRFILSSLLLLLLAGCATGGQPRDASAEADQVLASASEFRESRSAADQQIEAELGVDTKPDSAEAANDAAGGLAESEQGSGFLDQPASNPGPGTAFYVYLGIGVLLFGYIVWLLWDRSRQAHSHHPNEGHYVRVR